MRQGVRKVRTSVTVGVASSVANDRHNENDVIMRTGAASSVGARRHDEDDVIMRMGSASAVCARRHNENDVTVTIAGLWRYGD